MSYRLWFSFLLALAGLGLAENARGADKPNLLILYADDLG